MTDLHTLYLPIVMNTAPPQYGVNIDGPVGDFPIEPNRIYQTPARWMGVDDWLHGNLSAFGYNPFIIGTHTCPEIYRMYPDRMGSEPRPECYEDFAMFVEALSWHDPWAIEIWREPDCPTYSVKPEVQYWYGAWVTDEDYYAAGKRYGNLLSCVYPVLSSTGCLTIGGALQNPHLIQGQEFLRGMLETGECDYVSIHLYSHYNTDYKSQVEKTLHDIALLADRPLIVTETALLTTEGLAYDTPEFQAAQAEYLAWFRPMMIEAGIPWLWYASDNTWRNCGLKRRSSFMPVYDEWKG